MLDPDDLDFIRDNIRWLSELRREPEHSYKAEKFCNINGCSELVARTDWGKWILCPKHKRMCEFDYKTLMEIGFKNA